MVKFAPTFSKVSAALVSMASAFKPTPSSWADKAMEKHPACAAAMSSSGLVPTPFSKRVENEYCVCERTPLAVLTVPRPSFSPPCQWALAVLCIALLLACADAQPMMLHRLPPPARPCLRCLLRPLRYIPLNVLHLLR